MGNRTCSICHDKVFPNQPIGLQVTEVNGFPGKNGVAIENLNSFSLKCGSFLSRVLPALNI